MQPLRSLGFIAAPVPLLADGAAASVPAPVSGVGRAALAARYLIFGHAP